MRRSRTADHQMFRHRYSRCVNESMVAVFRTRLAETIARTGSSRSAFAEAAGVDRSTLSQLLSTGNRRLPRTETLLALATLAEVSIDWLLGRSEVGGVRADIVAEQPRIEPGARTPDDERLSRWLVEATGTKIRYVPSTLPDLLKTDAVIRHEVARWDSTSPAQQIEISADRLSVIRETGTDMECATTVQTLEGFARGEGLWRTLDRRRRLHQLDHLVNLVDELYPSARPLRCAGVDLRREARGGLPRSAVLRVHRPRTDPGPDRRLRRPRARCGGPADRGDPPGAASARRARRHLMTLPAQPR
jgi:transcriptional regulator with XRE-family HTH domain